MFFFFFFFDFRFVLLFIYFPLCPIDRGVPVFFCFCCVLFLPARLLGVPLLMFLIFHGFEAEVKTENKNKKKIIKNSNNNRKRKKRANKKQQRKGGGGIRKRRRI